MQFKVLIFTFCFFVLSSHTTSAQIALGQGQIVGEVTVNSVILQTRLTKGTLLVKSDLPGQKGVGRFQISESENFANAFYSNWATATSQNDYIIKAPMYDLLPDAQYYFRLIYGTTKTKIKKGPTGTFHTLPLNTKTIKPERLAIISSMNYDAFYNGINAYEGKDKHLGFPAFELIREQKPTHLILAGNNVFYDDPKMDAAICPTTLPSPPCPRTHLLAQKRSRLSLHHSRPNHRAQTLTPTRLRHIQRASTCRGPRKKRCGQLSNTSLKQTRTNLVGRSPRSSQSQL